MEGGQEVQNRRQKAKEQQCMDDAGEGSCRWREDRWEKQLGARHYGSSPFGHSD